MLTHGESVARILVLWAAESSPNLGVAALARGSREILVRCYPGAEISFANYGARPVQLPWGRPGSLLKERLLRKYGMQEYLAGFDLVWDTRSGDSFADIYGLRRHLTMCMVHEFAAQARVPVVMAPQTIGPFRLRRARALARRSLSRSTLVFARDLQSARLAEGLGRPVDAIAPDMVFAVPAPPSKVHHDVLINVSGILWSQNSHVDAGYYRRTAAEIVKRLLASGRGVGLLAHVLDSASTDNDIPALNDLAHTFGESVEVIVPTDLDSARQHIAGAQLVIGSRMHACLNALSLGVPAIALAYSRKFASLLESVEWNAHFDLRSRSEDLAARVVARAQTISRESAEHTASIGRGRTELTVRSLRDGIRRI